MREPHSNQRSLTVTDPAQIDLLLDVTAAQRVGVFMGREHTLGTAAAELSIPASSLAYWVKRLVRTKLIAITRLEPRAGRAIPHYRAVADEFIIPFALMPPDAHQQFIGSARSHMYEAFTTAVDTSGRNNQKGAGLRITMQPNRHLEFGVTKQDPPLPAKAIESWSEIGLTTEEHAELSNALDDLIDRFATGKPTRGRKKYLMVVGLAPAPTRTTSHRTGR
jgi:hypothetical protein